MRPLRTAAVLLFLPLAATAAPSDDDWKLMGGVLSLVQQLVHLAATSPDPGAASKGVDALLSGANPEANRIAGTLMSDVLEDMPQAQRDTFVALGRDLITLARREQSRSESRAEPRTEPRTEPRADSPVEALRARKELHAMGLRYWDEQQFLEAVRRGDRMAVDLYLAAQGLQSQADPRIPQKVR